MEFSDDEIREFKTEANELLDSAENELLALESDGAFHTHYDAIFRVFHSLKGGAGMLGLDHLQQHMHELESIFSNLKSDKTINRSAISFFLKGSDAAKQILDGRKITFDYNLSSSRSPDPTPASSTPMPSDSVEPEHSVGSRSVDVYAIDDEPDILSIIKDILASSGISCQTFTDPTLALDAIRKQMPLVALTDVSMPNITGLQLLKEIRKIDPDLPVIFLSGYIDKPFLLEALEYSTFAALEKPFNESNLLAQVLTAIRYQKSVKLITQSINLLMYQFSDLDQFLQKEGKEDIRRLIRRELDQILANKKSLRHLHKGKP